MHIEKCATKHTITKREQSIIDTLNLTSEVCTQRSYRGMFEKMREHMPRYFGYEDVGILLLNKTSKCRVIDIYNDVRWLALH